MPETIISKRCSHCKEIKPIKDFTKLHNGKLGCHNQCKICKSEWAKSDKAKLHKKIYQQSQRGKDARYLATRNHRINNPEKAKARHAIEYAIHAGKLCGPKTLACYYCPKPAEQYHHWHGYDKKYWLDVVPVCKKCHYEIHSFL